MSVVLFLTVVNVDDRRVSDEVGVALGSALPRHGPARQP